MADDQITVDGEIFLGRLPEQAEFRKVLRTVLSDESAGRNSPPYIFLVQGAEGMGKSKLLRRLRDIAARESPFDAYFHTMLVDWEWVNFQNSESRSSLLPDQIIPVFGHFYRAARDAGWGHQFSDYQADLRGLNRAEGKFVEAFDLEVWTSPLEPLRSLSRDELVLAIRLGDVPYQHEPLQSVWREVDQTWFGRRDVDTLRETAQDWLKARAQFEAGEDVVFQEPNRSFAKTLGQGLRKIAENKPLVVLLDSYGRVTQWDPWIRLLIKSSGNRVIWVITGDGDLADFAFSAGLPPFRQEFSENFMLINLDPLNDSHMVEYLQSRAPDRLVTRSSVEKMFAVTHGIPLAMQLIANLWAGGVSASEITEDVPKEASHNDILQFLSLRLLSFCENVDDRTALTLLSVQREPDEEVLAEVLEPGRSTYEVRNRLRQLSARYPSIRINGGASLQATVAGHLRTHLLRRRLRMSDELKAVSEKAADFMLKSRNRLEAGFPRLEDRFESDEYRRTLLASIHWLILHNEFGAWRLISTDFIDALGYDQAMSTEMVAVVERLRPVLSNNGLQRLNILRTGLDVYNAGQVTNGDDSVRLDEGVSFLAELEVWLNRYGSKDEFVSERQAIIDLRRGELFFRAGQYDEAVSNFDRVEKNLPSRGQALAGQLAIDYEKVGEKMAWSSSDSGEPLVIQGSPVAEACLKKSIAMGRRRALSYYALGSIQFQIGKVEVALENLLQAVTLNPGNAAAWYVLGEVYRRQELLEKAIPAYRRVLELLPKNVRARLSLAASLKKLKQDDKFISEMRILHKLIAAESEYLRACYECLASNVKAALDLLVTALNKNQTSKEEIRQEPCFEHIQVDPNFLKLMSRI